MLKTSNVSWKRRDKRIANFAICSAIKAVQVQAPPWHHHRQASQDRPRSFPASKEMDAHSL